MHQTALRDPGAPLVMRKRLPDTETIRDDAATMLTSLSQNDALAIETAELEAWLDMYRGVPYTCRRQYEPELIEFENVVLTRCRAIPFVHFNAALSLGVQSPATEATVDAVIAAYQAAGIRRFTILHHRFCRPLELPDWLRARGFQPRPGWDRVDRLAAPPV